MNTFESMRIALRSLASNKLRSVLTMLGMIIGVGAVIALVGAGAGAQAQVAERFSSLGTNLLVISPRGGSFRGVAQGSSSSRALTNDDVVAIANQATLVAAIAPEYSTRAQVVNGNKNVQTSVLGVTAEYLRVRNYTVARGRFLEAQDLSAHAKVAVLGAAVVSDLFSTTLVDPLGKTIKINRESYVVIGILASKGVSGFQNMDDQVFIPLTTAQIKFGGAGNTSLQSINVQAIAADKMDFAQAEITAILRANHGLATSQSNNFNIQNQAQIVETAQQTTQTFTQLLGSIAAISLVVGGIGIMNIMLVSVTERTREIGIRKAAGAMRRDILMQFLVEAVVLSLVGGITGVIIGYAGAGAVTQLLGGTRALVTGASVAMALGVSIAVGLFFGIYPATRAAALNPIDALRYE